MLEAAYEITISLVCVFVAGAMLGWFLQECLNTREKIRETEKELSLKDEDLGDDDEQL